MYKLLNKAKRRCVTKAWLDKAFQLWSRDYHPHGAGAEPNLSIKGMQQEAVPCAGGKGVGWGMPVLPTCLPVSLLRVSSSHPQRSYDSSMRSARRTRCSMRAACAPAATAMSIPLMAQGSQLTQGFSTPSLRQP